MSSMINGTSAENFDTGGGERSHLFPPPESVSGSESEDKRMAAKNVRSLEHLPSNLNHNSPGDSQPSKRTLQNRKAQREFRERKASYVKSLEQRIRAYEANEMQGNVELQRVARRLKEENDQLREQLRQMSERLQLYEGGSSGTITALPPARTPTRSRGAPSHQQQSSQSSQPLYNQSQGFSNDITTYDMISGAPQFQTSSNPQGYPPYFAQQQQYNSYSQHQPLYGQDQPGDVTINPDIRRTPARDNPSSRQPSSQ